MKNDSLSLGELRSPIHELPPAQSGSRIALDAGEADSWLGGGLLAGGIHEFFAAHADDRAAAAGFALLLGTLHRHGHGGEILWIGDTKAMRLAGLPYGPGFVQMGIDAGKIVVLFLPDTRAMLRSSLDAVRDGAFSAVVLELIGKQPLFDLTASRRLALAAAESGTTVLAVRGDAAPSPSAAHTRWQVAAAPSRVLEAGAPGNSAFDLRLLRQRGGRDGLHIILEWDRDTASFHTAGAAAAPLSRDFSAVAVGRAGVAQRDRAA